MGQKKLLFFLQITGFKIIFKIYDKNTTCHYDFT
jgi:hypothetical protein